jgi:hypothetical protein
MCKPRSLDLGYKTPVSASSEGVRAGLVFAPFLDSGHLWHSLDLVVPSGSLPPSSRAFSLCANFLSFIRTPEMLNCTHFNDLILI